MKRVALEILKEKGGMRTIGEIISRLGQRAEGSEIHVREGKNISLGKGG